MRRLVRRKEMRTKFGKAVIYGGFQNNVRHVEGSAFITFCPHASPTEALFPSALVRPTSDSRNSGVKEFAIKSRSGRNSNRRSQAIHRLEPKPNGVSDYRITFGASLTLLDYGRFLV